MTDVFLYGTLRHRPLLEVVLGPEMRKTEVIEGLLPDYAACVAPGNVPAIRSWPGENALGQVLVDVSNAVLARLDFYEGLYHYDRREKHLRTGASAQVYFPPQDLGIERRAWSLTDWIEADAALACMAAEEVMSLQHQMGITEARAHMGRIRARAQSRLAARTARHGAGTLQGRVDVETRERHYFKFYAFDEMRIRHETFQGGMSEPLDRGVFVPSDAAIVLPYDPVRDRVLLVEQVRMGPLARGDAHVWQLEPVAGLVDPGETPRDTALREAVEEAGVHLARLECVAEAYPSPGGSSDFQYLYVGLCDLPDRAPQIGGLDEEGEDIRVHHMAFDDLLRLADRAELANLPLATIAFWLARHRQRLRSPGGADT